VSRSSSSSPSDPAGPAADRALEQAILDLLEDRTGTICPSEAARKVAGEDDWRALMQPARDAAARLVAAGLVEVTQRGQVVDVARAHGPVRIRRTVADR
jgi:hypothetical protein